ncbi:hypothetical protein ATM97_28995 [Nocardia sp. MH4]|nr:hypothetical protein [Nocardia sp. MH4]
MDHRGESVYELSHHAVGEVGPQLVVKAVELECELVGVHGGDAVEDFRRDDARVIRVALSGEDRCKTQLREGV